MKPKKILLIEDRLQDVKLTRRAFEKCKIANEVVVAYDGVEALDYLFGRGAFSGRNLEDKPTLILLDLKLPKVNGLQVLRELRSSERYRWQPIVILISSREEEDLINGYNLGANSYVCKPIRFEEFALAVQNLGMYWLLLNEPPPSGREESARNLSAAGDRQPPEKTTPS